MLITYNYKDGEKCIDYDVIQQYMNKKENTDNLDYQCSPLKVIGEPSEIRIVEFAFCSFYQTLKIGSVMRYLTDWLLVIYRSFY